MIKDSSRKDIPRLVLTNTGAIRFDIFKGPFTIDTTYTVSPFTSGFRFIEDVPLEIASQLLRILNQEVPQLSHDLRPLTAPIPARSSPQALPLHAKDSNQHPLTVSTKEDDNIPLAPGYTTHDDAGADGDDTLHSEIKFYAVPNCIEARIGFPGDAKDPEKPKEPEPEIVDLVYNEFIQPYILLALKFLGTGFEKEDTGAYMEGMDMTRMIETWVKEKWPC